MIKGYVKGFYLSIFLALLTLTSCGSVSQGTALLDIDRSFDGEGQGDGSAEGEGTLTGSIINVDPKLTVFLNDLPVAETTTSLRLEATDILKCSFASELTEGYTPVSIGFLVYAEGYYKPFEFNTNFLGYALLLPLGTKLSLHCEAALVDPAGEKLQFKSEALSVFLSNPQPQTPFDSFGGKTDAK